MAKKRRTVHPSVVMQSRFGDEHLELIGVIGTAVLEGLTLLEPQSRFGDKLLGIRVVCPQNGTPVLKGLKGRGGGGKAEMVDIDPACYLCGDKWGGRGLN